VFQGLDLAIVTKQHTGPLYEFGSFRFSPFERILLRDGQRVHLGPKGLDTLVVLLENRGHIVGKDELLKRVWTGTFVEEHTVAQTVFTLRKALENTPEGQPYIETISRLGYRFVGPVTEVNQVVSEAAKETPAENSAPQNRRLQNSLIAGGVVLGLVVLGSFLVPRLSRRNDPPAGKIVLAVLPFENLSGDSQQEYFSDGLTEEMITQLGNLEPNRLGVIARTSIMQYKDTKKGAREIGRELGVDYILEGSVRQEGDHVRITAQLIQAKDQTHLWARDYDRNLRDILALQSDVAVAIAREIKLKLSPEEHTRMASAPALDPEAYELYLKGRYFWNKRSADGFGKAIQYFQQVITRDPKYAQAYAGLADAYALLGSLPNTEMPRSVAMPKAKAAALKALQLNDSLAEAHASLAFVEMQYEWDWPGSEKEFKRALELNPNYATAHQWYAIWLMAQGKSAEALEEERRAQEADPLSLIIKTDTAQLLVYSGRYDEGAQQAQGALEIDPGFLLAHDYLAEAYTAKQDYQAAIAQFQIVLAISKGDVWASSGIARTYTLAGQKRKSEAILRDILNGTKNREDLAIQLAMDYGAQGENDRAFAWLERAYQHRDGGLIFLNVAPGFQSLRGDPRFDDLLQHIGLPRNATGR
jgi:TolB-like protein/DNA-binding winged helix-turn-helix (wHTH) protein/Flp pilus assembly protein TadD